MPSEEAGLTAFLIMVPLSVILFILALASYLLIKGLTGMLFAALFICTWFLILGALTKRRM
ncbi:MAG: hypothetical protein AB1476_01520 [Candidatus Hadarchaeota archaeon]